MDTRQPWEKAVDAGLARNRHPRPGIGPGNVYRMSNIGRARAETAAALDEAGRQRRRAVEVRYLGDRVRFVQHCWYAAFRDAAGWRCRAEDSQRRGTPRDLGASSGSRLRLRGDQWALPVLPPTWEKDRRRVGSAEWDRLLSRL
jgi:hypothetical protein